jgi:hypothetical protein
MNQIDKIKTVIEELGLSPIVEGDTVFFRYEMKNLLINVIDDDEKNESDKDNQYVSILYNCYYKIEPEEVEEVLVVCNKANRELRQIKTFVTEDFKNVCSSYEFWYLNDDDLKNSIKYGLVMCSVIRPWFYQQIAQIKNESVNQCNEE